MPRHAPSVRPGRPSRAGAAATIELRVRLTSEEHALYSDAASEAGLSLSEFVRASLDARVHGAKRKA